MNLLPAACFAAILLISGRICLGCPEVECQECDEVDPEWEVTLDGFGCPTSCPACKGPGICAFIRCGLPDVGCETLINRRGPDGEVCTGCFLCADSYDVCADFDCDPLPKDCKNKPLHDLVKVGGRECLSCPVCSTIPKCEPYFCPLCVGPPGWVGSIDENGCPFGCPPCGPVCPELGCMECENGVDPSWEPTLDNNGCRTSCPACQGPGICALIFCAPPDHSCNQLSNIRGSDGEVCQACYTCVDDLKECPEFSCPALPDSCRNKPVYDVVQVNGLECLSCPECSSIPVCLPLICPDCVTELNWVSPVDENGCSTQCAPCKVDLPLCPSWNRRRCQSDKYEEIQLGHRTCIGCPRSNPHRRHLSQQ